MKVLEDLFKAGLIGQDKYDATKQALMVRQFGKAATPVQTAKASPLDKQKSEFDIPANINFGDYHALIIGIDNYKNFENLKTARADAQAVAKMLGDKYGFNLL